MRIVLFFDLPVETSAQQKAYRKFHKFLVNSGYIMMQESVYSKLVINQASMNSALTKLRSNKPPSGIVQILKVTEKQYADMEFLCGSSSNEKLNSTDRLVIL